MSRNNLTPKLMGHRNNIGIALIVGVVAMIINFIFGFSIDTVIWGISIIQLYRWYNLSETYIQSLDQNVLSQLKSYKNLYLGLWVVAGAFTVILWGVEGDLILGIVISGAATFIMNQFEVDASSGAEGLNPKKFDSKAEHGTMFCGNCGSKQDQSKKFCTDCGNQMMS